MPGCSPVQSAFFTRLIPLVRPIATRMKIAEDYLLALCAFEDSWANDKHNDLLHNLLGITQAGGHNLAFASDQACCDYWEAHYARAVQNSRDFDDFDERIKAFGYNSVNPHYGVQLKAVYRSVLLHKKACVQ